MPAPEPESAPQTPRLIGEVVRPYEAPTDASQDAWVLYPGIRPWGDPVGFIYQVDTPQSQAPFQRVVAYFDGRLFCTCSFRKLLSYRQTRRCDHSQAVREFRSRHLANEPYPCL